MTHTTCPTQPAKTRPTTTISRWLIAACAAAAILPAPARADHQVNRHMLLPIVNKLHADLVTFEQLAAQRWFPDHEFEYIRLMTKQACRLDDAVKCDEHFGRIRGDYYALRAFVQTADNGFNRHRAAKFDHQLMQLWHSIKHDFDGVACLVTNQCSASCGHLAPPVAVPPYEFRGAPRRAPGAPAIPPSGLPPTRDFSAPDGRAHDIRLNQGRRSASNGSLPELQFNRSPWPDRPFDARDAARGDTQRQPNATLAWLERLSAVVAR